jgi:hypothetical protein
VLEAAEAAASALSRLTNKDLRGFALLYGIQNFINLFILTLATNL